MPTVTPRRRPPHQRRRRLLGTTSPLSLLAPLSVLSLAALTALPVGLAAPAVADSPSVGPASSLAAGSASAVSVVVGGTPGDSGTYAVSNDGTQEASTGTNRPALTLLGGQSMLSAGMLAQDATTSVSDGRGGVSACSGLAGTGATLLAAGGGGCLVGGETLRLDAGTIDLSQVRVVESDMLQGVDQQLRTALEPVLSQVLPAASDGARTALAQLGEPGVHLDLGAVQSWCSATPATAGGGARLAGAAAYVQLPDRRIDLVSLPVDPAPNSEVATGLDQVVAAILDAVRQQVRTSVDGTLRSNPLADQLPLGQLPGSQPLDQALEQVEAALVENVVSQVQSQLGPLEENLLRGTLNRQTSSGPGSIEVQALDLEVLPAASDFGVQALHLQVGRSTCAAAARVDVAGVQESAPQPGPSRSKNPRRDPTEVPTRVPSGLRSAPEPDDGWPLPVLGALGLLAAAAGGVAYRRALRDLADDRPR